MKGQVHSKSITSDRDTHNGFVLEVHNFNGARSKISGTF